MCVIQYIEVWPRDCEHMAASTAIYVLPHVMGKHTEVNHLVAISIPAHQYMNHKDYWSVNYPVPTPWIRNGFPCSLDTWFAFILLGLSLYVCQERHLLYNSEMRRRITHQYRNDTKLLVQYLNACGLASCLAFGRRVTVRDGRDREQ